MRNQVSEHSHDKTAEQIRAEWKEAMEEMAGTNYRFVRVPMEEQCLLLTDNPRRGKNMFALGVMSWVYMRDIEHVRESIAHTFRHKSEEVYQRNIDLMEAGVKWAEENLDFRIEVPPMLEPG